MTKNLTLGYAGEYGARAMTIDLYEEATLWPDATPKLLLCRPGEDAPYVFEGTTYENSCLTFTPRKEDTAIAGTGYAQVYFYGADGALLGKSSLMTTLILRAMSGDVTQEPSAEQKSYYDNLMEQVALAVAAGRTAPGYAQSAAESAAAAAAAQEAAEAAASSVTITTDEINAAGNAALSAIEQKRASALADIPDDYTALYGDISSLKDTKADVIIDTSARVASHELHAQDGPLAVTLFGKTTETGSGDKSPDNPYTISGVDAARVHAGGKNLLPWPYAGGDSATMGGITYTVQPDGGIHVVGTRTGTSYYRLMGASINDLSNGFEFPVASVLTAGSSLFASSHRRKDGAYGTSVIPANTMVSVLYLQVVNSVTDIDTVIYPMLNLGTTRTEYEKPCANVITPPLLPDSAPLMGNGTVDDSVENDVPSGCDKRIVLDGTQTPVKHTVTGGASGRFSVIVSDCDGAYPAYSDNLPSASIDENYAKRESVSSYNGRVYVYIAEIETATVSEIQAYLAANPLTVFYRSTDYTSDKNLRVCKTVRKYKTVTFDGSTDEVFGLNGICYVLNSAYIATPVASAMNLGNAISDYLPIRSAEDVYAGIDGIAVRKDGRMQIFIDGVASVGDLRTYLAAKPLTVTYQLATPETYMTDPIPLRKPTGIMPVTVTGSGETAVEYPHETKHYIDSQIAAAVALALGN